MKSKGINWRNWEKLLEFLKTRTPKQVNMLPVLNTKAKSLKDLLPRNVKCDTAGCIAGWGAVLWATRKDNFGTGWESGLRMCFFFADKINLESDALDYVVQGMWKDDGIHREKLGKREVIRYMTKALKARDVMVKL